MIHAVASVPAPRMPAPRIAVVVPAYRVTAHVLGVLAAIPAEVAQIFVIDDACPDGSGALVERECRDPRVTVLRHAHNQGVGGAVLTGYRAALADGCAIAVKVDGDGQMDPAELPRLVAPIAEGRADYTKGNRFFWPDGLASMPRVRLVGNAVLSFFSKAASGYWSVMDPTNGYTALALPLLPLLETDKLARRYFFESDLLFRLGLLRAVVTDVPMHARYGSERSNLSVAHSALTFPFQFAARFAKRFAYNYLLRDFNSGSAQALLGLLLFVWGVAFGGWSWVDSWRSGAVASSGTVMLAGLPLIVGVQLLLGALQFDIENQPRTPVHPHASAG